MLAYETPRSARNRSPHAIHETAIALDVLVLQIPSARDHDFALLDRRRTHPNSEHAADDRGSQSPEFKTAHDFYAEGAPDAAHFVDRATSDLRLALAHELPRMELVPRHRGFDRLKLG